MSSAATAQQPGPFFRPRRLGHTNLYVSDLNRAMDFYINVIGIEESYRTPLRGGGFVTNGNTHHDIGFVDVNGSLGKARGARPGMLNHLGFELESELALVESYEAADEAGQKFPRTADHDVVHSVYGADPDGNKYELYADITREWRIQRTGIVTKPKPDWTPRSTPPVREPCYDPAPEIRRVEHAVFHPRRTTHATIVVCQLAASLDHYRRVVGLTVLHRDPAGEYAVLGGSCGETSLVLIAAGGGRAPGIHHTGMVVATRDDLDRSAVRAAAEGVAIEMDLTHRGRRAVHIRDPDGLLTQLYHDAGGVIAVDGLDAGLATYLL